MSTLLILYVRVDNLDAGSYQILVTCGNCDTHQWAVIPKGSPSRAARSQKCLNCGCDGELRKVTRS